MGHKILKTSWRFSRRSGRRVSLHGKFSKELQESHPKVQGLLSSVLSIKPL